MNYRLLLLFTLSFFACEKDLQKPLGKVFEPHASVYQENPPIPVTLGSKCLYVNPYSKQIVLDAAVGFCGQFSEGLAPVVRDGYLGYINTRGEWFAKNKLPFRPIYIHTEDGMQEIDYPRTLAELANREVHNGMAWVPTQNGNLFVNLVGENLIAGAWLNSYGFKEGYAPVQAASGWNLINLQGEVLSADTYEEIGLPSEGIFTFKLGGKWGWKTTTGQILMPPTQQWAYASSNGFILASDSSGFNYYSIQTGNRSGPFSEAYPFDCGVAVVKKENKYYLLDQNYNLKLTDWKDAFPGSSCRIIASRDQAFYGVFNSDGQAICPQIYDKGFVYNNSFATAQRGEQIVVLDSNAREIWKTPLPQ